MHNDVLMPLNYIQQWVLAGESIEEWLKIKGFKAWWGSSRWVVAPIFLLQPLSIVFCA